MNIFLPHNYFISRSLELLILDEYKIDKTNFVLLMYKNLYSYFLLLPSYSFHIQMLLQ